MIPNSLITNAMITNPIYHQLYLSNTTNHTGSVIKYSLVVTLEQRTQAQCSVLTSKHTHSDHMCSLINPRYGDTMCLQL